MTIKQTQRALLNLFWMQLIIPALIYTAGEFFHVDMSLLAGISASARYALTVGAVVLTLALIPLALRLFRFRRVHDDLILRQADALSKWGVIRLCILGDLLLLCTALYYALGYEPAFGWLAVITMLAMPFVYPTMNRCLAETEADDDDAVGEDARS